MQCFTCEKPIEGKNGYFSFSTKSGEKYVHLVCKPVFFFNPYKENHQGDMFIPSPNWKANE